MSDQAPQAAVCWNEIPVSDMDKAVEFYNAVVRMDPDNRRYRPEPDFLAGR